MSFLKNIPLMVANDIRQRLGGAFAPDAKLEILKIGTPAALIPDYTTTYNTAMLVNIDDAYQQWLVYNRVDASTYYNRFWSTGSIRGIAFSKPAIDIYGALDDINKFLVTDFTQDEVYNDPIVAGDTLVVRFTANCRWFTGQVTLPIEAKHRTVNGKVMAKAVYNPAVLRGAIRTQNKINPGVLTYALDYDGTALLGLIPTLPMQSALTNGVLGSADSASIAALLKAKDGLPWQSTATAGEFNLYGGILLFNGAGLDFNISRMLSSTYNGDPKNDTLGLLLSKFRLPRLTRRYLAVVLPSITYCTNLDRDLIFIQYGPSLNVATLDAKPDPRPVHHWPLEGNYRNYGTDPKKPEFAARGSFQIHLNIDGSNLLHVHRDTAGTPSSPIGAELPINKDFTFSFRYLHGSSDTAIADGAIQFWQQSKQGGSLTGRVAVLGGLFTLNASATALSAVTAANSVFSDTKNWPYTTCVTIVREGDEWAIYHDGMLRCCFRALVPLTTVIDSLYCVNSYFYIKDIRYYDTALTPDQVRRMVRLDPALSGLPYKPDLTVPAPTYHFPLKGSLLDVTGQYEFLATGKDKVQYSTVTYNGLTTKFYYSTYNGISQLTKPMPRSDDFTLQWEMYGSAVPGNYNTWCEGGTSEAAFTSSGFWFYTNGQASFGYVPSTALIAGQVYKHTVVKRGRSLYWYLNGIFIKAELLPEGYVMKPITHIVTPSYNAAGAMKDVKYWDRALTEDQVIASHKEPF